MKTTYRCCFPGCKYETDNRSLIEFHHIHPRELGNVLSKNVTVELCPTHHKLIFHPGATHGQHAVEHDGSMTIVQVAQTSTGKSVIFRDSNGTEISVDIDTVTPKKYAIYCISWDLVHGIADQEDPECPENITKIVDTQGYYHAGARVYYSPSNRGVAADLLASHIVQYMTRTKSEYDLALDRARKDWKLLAGKAAQ